MVSSDCDLQSVHVHAGWEGSTSDARVLQDAINHGFQVPHGKFYLVGVGYANTPQFLAPNRGTRYHLQEQGGCQIPQNHKELFNFHHAQLETILKELLAY